MAQLATGEPVWNLQFDEKGNLTAPVQAGFITGVAGQHVEDLFMFCHGWGAAQDQAQALYNAMFPMIRSAAQGIPALGTLGFAGIYWPALWFPDTPATTTPPAPAGFAQAVNGAAEPLNSGTAAVTGAQIAASLRDGFADPEQQKTITQIGELIDQGQAMVGSGQTDDAKQQLVKQIGQLIKSLTPPPDGRDQDAGERALLMSADPVNAFELTASAFGTTPSAGSAQGIGDWLGAAVNGAKDAVRVLSYWTMKARAGTIGQTGLGPLLTALHASSPGTRVHLVGHSFGARLVSFALAGIDNPGDSPVSSLTLLEGAFSHWSFSGAAGNPFGAPGGLDTLNDRVNGPLVATFSSFDWAVGVWYPKASFLAGSNLQAAGPDPWGGMGADGFQPTNSATTVTMPAGGGLGYGFRPNAFYRANAASVINNTANEPFSGAHSDIKKMPVAQLIAAAAAAHG
jgi:hypothetical protein